MANDSDDFNILFKNKLSGACFEVAVIGLLVLLVNVLGGLVMYYIELSAIEEFPPLVEDDFEKLLHEFTDHVGDAVGNSSVMEEISRSVR